MFSGKEGNERRTYLNQKVRHRTLGLQVVIARPKVLNMSDFLAIVAVDTSRTRSIWRAVYSGRRWSRKG